MIMTLLSIVLARHARTRAQRALLLLSISCALWSGGIALNTLLHSTLVEMIIFAAGAVGGSAQLCFALTIWRSPIRWCGIVYAIGGILALAAFWNGAVFSSLHVMPQGYTILRNGFLSHIYAFALIIFWCATLCALLYARSNHAHRRERRILTILTLYVLGAFCISIITNSILPVFYHIYIFNTVGPISVSLLTLLFIVVAIRSHIILPQHLITTRLLYAIYALCLFYIFGAYMIILTHQGTHTLSAATIMALLTIVCVIGFDIVRRAVLPHSHSTVRTHYSIASALRALHAPSQSDRAHRIARIITHRCRARGTLILTATTLYGDITLSTKKSRMLRSNRVLAHLLRITKPTTPYDLPDAVRTICMRSGITIIYPIRHKTCTIGILAPIHVRRPLNSAQHIFITECALLLSIALTQTGSRTAPDDLHRIFTPLTIAHGHLSLLQQSVNTHTARASHALRDTVRGTRSALTSTPSSSISNTPPRCNLSALVSTRCHEWNPAIIAHGGTIHITTPPHLIAAAPCNTLTTVIDNILENAVKYRDRSRSLHITVSGSATQERITLRICDTGMGFGDTNNLSTLFHHGVRGKRTPLADGSGIGLAQCASYMTQIGGTISAEHNRPHGACIILHIPRSGTTTHRPS